MFPPNTRILLLDDVLTMRKVVKNTLKSMGLTDIQEATDGNQGWELLQTSKPSIDLIISDWDMPNCTGFELLKRVRGDERFSNIPFVLLTAEADAQQVKSALSLSVSGYIIKPFSPDTFKEKLQMTYRKVAS